MRKKSLFIKIMELKTLYNVSVIFPFASIQPICWHSLPYGLFFLRKGNTVNHHLQRCWKVLRLVSHFQWEQKSLSVRTIKCIETNLTFRQSEWNSVSQNLRTDRFQHDCICPHCFVFAKPFSYIYLCHFISAWNQFLYFIFIYAENTYIFDPP